jgi:tetratricopeptide (TPR) repeat protein
VFITLAPTSSFVPIATEVGAERRMYLPLMAVAALLVIPALSALRQRGFRTLAMVSVIAVALGIATVLRTREYATELSLAESTLAHWPTDVAHGMVGSALMQLQRHDEALSELRLGARTVPRSRYNLGVELYNLKRMDEATSELETFAGENLMDELAPAARRILGDAFVTQRRWNEAAKEYQLALSMIPNDADTKQKMLAAMNNQGLELAGAGRFAEAAALFRTVVGSDPADPAARHNLTAALLDNQDPRSAETEARKAIEASPRDAVLYDLLGRALAMQGRFGEALVQFRAALQLAPDNAEIRDDLEKVKTRK